MNPRCTIFRGNPSQPRRTWPGAMRKENNLGTAEATGATHHLLDCLGVIAFAGSLALLWFVTNN